MADSKKKLVMNPITDLAWFAPSENASEADEVAIPNTQEAALLVMKAALIETTASRGWPFVERFAETVVRDLETKALEEDDDVKASGLRRDARGARKFKDDLFKRIQIARNFDTEEGFVEVVTD